MNRFNIFEQKELALLSTVFDTAAKQLLTDAAYTEDFKSLLCALWTELCTANPAPTAEDDNTKICNEPVVQNPAQHLTQFMDTAEWEISWDGYYPYCTRCSYEPDRGAVIENGLPDVCPRCHRKMLNAAELNCK